MIEFKALKDLVSRTEDSWSELPDLYRVI